MTVPTMPFGKHKGQSFDQVPRGYFEWMLAQEWLQPQLRRQIEDFLEDDGQLAFDARDSGAPSPAAPAAPDPPRLGFTEGELVDLKRIVQTGMRTLLLQREPEIGDIARRRLERLGEKLRKSGLMEELK